MWTVGMRAPEGGVFALAAGIYGTWPAVSLAGDRMTDGLGVVGGRAGARRARPLRSRDRHEGSRSTRRTENGIVRARISVVFVILVVFVIVETTLACIKEVAPRIGFA